jgi:hypothetical protein
LTLGGSEDPWATGARDDTSTIRGGRVGPFFLKLCSYFPYNAKLCINGHEYLKRQLAKRGVAFEALDNGIKSCAEPELLQRMSDGLTAEKIDRLLRSGCGVCRIRSRPAT